MSRLKPNLTIDLFAEREITVLEGDKKVIKRVPAQSVEDGSAIFYTVIVRNRGRGLATNIVVDNPIPEHLVYVVGSAKGEQSAISFSIDGGNSYQEKTSLGHISPDLYTHIRWEVEDMPGKSRRKLEYETCARLKPQNPLLNLYFWLFALFFSKK